MEECAKCRGRGYIYDDRPGARDYRPTCPECEGSGKVESFGCPMCGDLNENPHCDICRGESEES
jgi:DnaJ-class molecular chaperone